MALFPHTVECLKSHPVQGFVLLVMMTSENLRLLERRGEKAAGTGLAEGQVSNTGLPGPLDLNEQLTPLQWVVQPHCKRRLLVLPESSFKAEPKPGGFERCFLTLSKNAGLLFLKCFHSVSPPLQYAPYSLWLF